MKRFIDILLSFITLISFFPVIVMLSVLIRTFLGAPIIFKQERVGINGTVFTMYKFRTMTDASDIDGNLLPDEDRMTKFGIFLRSTSLDELPELFNILIGDMSLVGPRPLLVEYLPLYSEEQSRRHSVRPGLTGWAQVNGRNAISWPQKLAYDVWYVDNRTLALDFKIIFMTFAKVLKREGVNAQDSVSAKKFNGEQ